MGFVRKSLAILALSTLPACAGLAAPVTIDVNNAALWASATAGGTNPVTFGFDYSALGIPQAPGSSTTTAMRLQANTAGTATVGGVTVSPTAVNLAGDYVIHAEVWQNTFGPLTTTGSNGSGTSQFFGMGSGYSSGVNYRAGATTGGGSGTWFAAVNDGGFSATSTTIRDFNAFVGSGAVAANFITAPAVYKASTVDTTQGAQDSFNAYYGGDGQGHGGIFPGNVDITTINGGQLATLQNQSVSATPQTGNTVTGAPQFAWHDYTITRTGGAIVWAIDGNTIATMDGSTTGTALTLDGKTSLTYFDATSGISQFPGLNFALVSNYSVESIATPEPAALSLLGVGTLVLARRRRRTV